MLDELYTLLKEWGKTPEIIISVVLIMSVFVEVSKIPINPYKFIANFMKKGIKNIGNILNEGTNAEIKEINKQIIKLEDKIKKIENIQIETQKKNNRLTILKFADECRMEIKHSKEMFDNILMSIDEYLELCELTEDPNSVVEEAIAYIKETNHERLKKNDYL